MLPRLLHLHPATCRRLTRLSKEAERDGAYRVAKRLQAVVLNAEGRTSGELAAVLKAPRSKISEWLAQYQAMASRVCWQDTDPEDRQSWRQSSANNWETFWIVGRLLTDWTMACGPRL